MQIAMQKKRPMSRAQSEHAMSAIIINFFIQHHQRWRKYAPSVMFVI